MDEVCLGVYLLKGEVLMKILVTGGAGFIGSHVVDGYIERGHDVVVVDNLTTGKRENLNPSARFYNVDIRSEDMRKIILEEKPHLINHHAAQISVPESVKDPLFDADINIMGLLNILESAIKVGTEKIIFISSGGTIYGEAAEYPTTEDYRPKPLSPYAISKAVSEDYLRFYKHQYGLDYIVLRYSNIYGPRQIPHGEAGVVSIFMDNLLNGRRSIIYAYPEEPEGMLRDYCYVGDVVRANILALKTDGCWTFNIGTGRATSTAELYWLILRASEEMGFAVDEAIKEPLREGPRAGDIRRSCLNVEMAENIMGWKAEVGLKEGIERTLRWRIENQ